MKTRSSDSVIST